MRPPGTVPTPGYSYRYPTDVLLPSNLLILSGFEHKIIFFLQKKPESDLVFKECLN
jgi:hypothetical protein